MGAAAASQAVRVRTEFRVSLLIHEIFVYRVF